MICKFILHMVNF